MRMISKHAHLYLHSFQFPVHTASFIASHRIGGYQEERHGRFGEVSGIRILLKFIHCIVSVVSLCCSFFNWCRLMNCLGWPCMLKRSCSRYWEDEKLMAKISKALKFQKSWQVLPGAPEIWGSSNFPE